MEDRSRFKKIGAKGDEQLQGRTVALAGLGSVGSTVAAMLAREDIDLRLIDMGRVDEMEMHRLSLFQEEDITKFKVKQAKYRLSAISPRVQVKSFHEEITDTNIFLLQGDVIVDTTNSEDINKLSIPFAVKKKVPLVLVRYTGSVAKILVLQKAAPAKILEKMSVPPIAKEGIFGPATTFSASIATAEIMKVLLGEKQSYLIECDGWDAKIKVTKL